jgi:hypothetical protein
LRKAVLQAFSSPEAAGQAWTSAEVATVLVGMHLVASLGRSERTALRHTLGNMVAAGELKRAGTRRVPGVKRPVPVYALTGDAVTPRDTTQALSFLFSRWRTESTS